MLVLKAQTFLVSNGFRELVVTPSLFIYQQELIVGYQFDYVDNIVVANFNEGGNG